MRFIVFISNPLQINWAIYHCFIKLVILIKIKVNPMLDIINNGNHTLLTAVTNPLEINQNWFSPDYWRSQNAIIAEKKGRSTTWFIQYSEGTAVLRHYWRGGLVGKILSDQYLFTGLKNTRTFQEFTLLLELQKRGLNVPTPIGAQIKTTGLVYRGDLLTQEIKGAQSLLEVLQQRPLTTEEITKIGETIAVFHQQGVYHADLNINNILFDEEQSIFIIDFDRGSLVQPGHPCLKQNIARLKRSFLKEASRNNPFYWQDSQWKKLTESYKKIMAS
jgi:3-deoxy-D-manno-octulosonic acid kinase